MMKKKVLAFGMALAMLLTMTACCDIRDGGSGGKTELNETVEVQWQFGRRLLEGIPEEDLATMRRCLERMDGNLNGICKEKR